jgi:hypothetical protein
MTVWVTPAQKKKIRALAKDAKKRDPKSSDSAIIRGIIEKI